MKIVGTRTATKLALAVASLLLGALPSQAEPLRVKLEYLPTGLHSWFHLAAEKGWYKEAGLDVVFEDGTGSVQTIQIVASGAADVGGTISFSSLAIANSKGVPVKAIAGMAHKSDLGFLFPRSKNWTSVKDFIDAGAEILITPETAWGPLMETVLRMSGLDSKNAKLLNVSGASKIATYIAKKDAVVTTVPPAILPVVEKDQPSKSLMLHEAGLILPGWGLISSDKVISARPDELRKFVTITMKAFDYVNNGHEAEGVDAVIKARPDGKVDREGNITAVKLYRPLFADDLVKNKPSGYMSPELWTKNIKAMTEAGLLSGEVKINDLFTNNFVQ
ncbi:MAG: hypothetical protein EXQ91_01655 [Alphaproteobacteria bacterium]|nr:hypothetical protein [Alphaproteobacteria bacterium]